MRVRPLALVAGLMAAGGAFAVSTAAYRPSPDDAAAQVAALSGGIGFFERRLAADPENFMAAGHLAERLMLRYQLAADQGDVERAEAVARRLADVSPGRAGALARLSSIHLAQHEFAEALQTAERAVEADADDSAALAALFDAAIAGGRYGRAEWALRKLPAGSAAREIRRAGWLAAHGEADGAYAALRGVCAQFRDESLRPQLVAWCLTELAGLQQERGGTGAARALLGDALRAQPGYRGAIEALADLAHADGEWKEAARLYGSVATDAHPDIYLRLAEVERVLGNPAAAARHELAFLRVAAAPGAEALHAHPLALFYAARPETRGAALEVARRDVARRPAVDSYNVLGWVHFRRGELREALAASDSAARWGAPSPTMHYRRARILSAMGGGQEASRAMREALRRPDLLDPAARLELRTGS